MKFRELIDAVDKASNGRMGGVYDKQSLEEIKDWGTPFDEIGHFIFRALKEAGCDRQVDQQSLECASRIIENGIMSLRVVDECIQGLEQRLSKSRARGQTGELREG